MKNRKIAALILSVMMVMCSMPSFVFAQENALAEMQGAPAVSEEAPADEAAAADEAVGSDDAQEKSAKAKDPQETVKKESGEKVKAESIDNAGKEGEEKAEPEEKKPAFSDSKTVDGVKVTVSAEEGAFPEGAKLVVSDVNASEEKKVDSAVDKVRDGDANVALSYIFDIHVEDKDGKEIQPADGRDVKVSFETEEVADSNLATDVYHVTDRDGSLKAEALDVKTDGDTASAGTDGFSYYTVEFTYGDLQYSMEGDTEVALSTILEKIGLTGTVTKAVSSNPDLFSVENNGGDWTVKALQAFCSNETLSLTIDGIDYVVKVTDSTHSHSGTVHGISGWNAWNDSSKLPTSGTYFLNTDVTVTTGLAPAGNINLCLNGHKITVKHFRGIYDLRTTNYTITIYDSDDNSGVITAEAGYGAIRITPNSGYSPTVTLKGGTIKGCNYNYGAAVGLNGDGGTFNMQGGVICNNTCSGNGAVWVGKGTFNMSGGTIRDNVNTSSSDGASAGVQTGVNTPINISGGTITGNSVPNGNNRSGGGIYVHDKCTNFKISGKVNVSGNAVGGKENNVFLYNDGALNVSGPLDASSIIGVTTRNKPSGTSKVKVTTGLNGKGNLSNFKSDDEDYVLVLDNNEAYLAAHTHVFNYSAEGETIIATCTAAGCTLPDNKATLKIIAPTLEVYGGQGSENATLEGEIPGVTPTIVYKKGGDTLSTAPTDAGDYRAQVTLTGENGVSVTAYVDYTIEKADISPVVTIDDWNYGESPKTPSITSGNPGGGAVTYKYYTDEACTTETSTDQGAAAPGGVPSKAGNYWVKATVAETDNYKSGTAKDGFKILAKDITVTGLSFDSKVYDGTTDTGNLDISNAHLVGVTAGDDVKIVSATGTFDNKNVGTEKTISNIVIVLGGADADGYTVTANPETITGDITAKPVTVTGGITAADKVYDGTTAATVDASGAQFDGVISGDVLTITATGVFSNADVGEGKTVHLTLGALGGENASNYVLYHAHGEVTTTASITPKPMTVSASGYSDEYDGNAHSITVTVTDPSDGYTVTYKGPEDSSYSETNPGFTDPGEYEVAYKVVADNYQTATGTKTVKIIGKDFEGITSSGYDAVYDGSAHGITVTVPGTYEPYKVTYSTSEDGTYSDDPIKYKNVTSGTKTVYYKVSKTGYNDFTGSNTVTITKKSVTVSGITANNKTYDGKVAAELVTENASFDGIITGDKLTVSTTGTFEDKNVGTGKAVTFGELTLGGEDAGNYELAASGHQTGTTASITKKKITVSGIKSEGKKYDGNTNATASLYYEDAKLAGKVDGDDEYCDDKLGVTATGTFADANYGVGKEITLTDLTLTGSEKDNYELAATGQQTKTTGDITHYQVNVTAVNKEKFYGEGDPQLTYTHGQIVEGDYLEGELARHAGEDAGTYTITAGTLHDHNHNYAINFTHGTFTIKKATTNNVAVTITGWTYGAEPKDPEATGKFGADTAVFTYSKTEDGEYTSTVPTQAGEWYVKATVPETDNYVGAVSQPVEFTIAQKEVGLTWGDTEFTYNGKEQKPTATATGLEDGDECTVTVSGGQTDANAKTHTDDYTATAESLSNDNYKLPENKTKKFTIAQKEITVSGITAKDKVYDGNKTAELVFSNVTLAGKVGSDGISVTAKGTFDNKNAGTNTVTISDLELTGDVKDNYVLAKTGQQDETKASIEKKDIAVDADAKHKFFGEEDPDLTYDADYLVEGDNFTGKLKRDEGENAGQYWIRQGTLSAGDNYNILFTSELFTIKQANNSVTAAIRGWTYGDTANDPTATADFGQDKATFAYCATEEGEYDPAVPTTAGIWYVKAIVPETANYKGAVSQPVEFTIEQKEVGLEWGDTEFTYNGNEQKPAATATGLEDGDECVVTVSDGQTDANAKTGTKKYTATATGLSNPNYKLPKNNTKDFTIAPKELTQSMISLDKDSFKYDGAKKGPEVTMTDTIEGAPAHMTEDVDYVLSGDVSSSEIGTHVITAEGKGNYTGSVMTSWVLYGKKTSGDKEEGTGGKGDLEIFVDVENTSTDVSVNNFTIDLVKGFLTKEDLARYEDGEDVLVYMLLIEQTREETGAGDRYLLGSLFREEGVTDIAWYDITIWKKIGNGPAVRVTNTGREIGMTFGASSLHRTAPKGYNREFYVGSVHDGAASILASSHTFKLNVNVYRFSTFAMAYKDTEIPVDPDDNGGGNGNGSSKGGGTNTGDENSLALWLAMLLASAGAFGGVAHTRRRSGKSK